MSNISRRMFGWFISSNFISVPRKYLAKFTNSTLADNYGTLVFFDSPEIVEAFDLIKQIRKDVDLGLNNLEAINIYTIVKATEKIVGDIAEVGVYEGGSAKIICVAHKNKDVHLFDTFDGLPDLSDKDSTKMFTKGAYYGNFEKVKAYLSAYSDVFLYKGLFPDTADPIKSKKFSFVHLDLDLYKSTLDCLKYFYPRMNKGGVIISHDYPTAEGVKKAFEEFFIDKPEILVRLTPSNQCLVVKLSSD